MSFFKFQQMRWKYSQSATVPFEIQAKQRSAQKKQKWSWRERRPSAKSNEANKTIKYNSV